MESLEKLKAMNFWKGKKVFITGHTGFKGSWLTFWLTQLEAKVCGYSLKPNTKKNLFETLEIKKKISKNHFSDIRDFKKLKNALDLFKPEVVFHLAAQPLVIKSYDDPLETYETNVLGTANLLEACKTQKNLKAILVITTDKCYKNKEWTFGYREIDELGGHDPYSASKACAELVVSSYIKSFYLGSKINVATARAGNVIGGGDWSKNRIVPDIISAYNAKKELIVRNPKSTRPWQHVIEPLGGYLKLARLLAQNKKFSGAWNFGPEVKDNLSVEEILSIFVKNFKKKLRLKKMKNKPKLHEAGLLMLDVSKAKNILKWKPKWSCEISIKKIIEWNEQYLKGNAIQTTASQINSYNKEI